jgi:hypothetical protein
LIAGWVRIQSTGGAIPDNHTNIVMVCEKTSQRLAPVRGACCIDQ